MTQALYAHMNNKRKRKKTQKIQKLLFGVLDDFEVKSDQKLKH
jgi:hypothetical protein